MHLAPKLAGFTLLIAASAASAQDCRAPWKEAIQYVEMPASPFQVLPTADGCWAFVSLMSEDSAARGVALLRRSGGTFTVARQVRLGDGAGMALTHDGRTLVVTSSDRIDFLDVGRFINGEDPLLGSVTDSSTRGHIYALITRDDRLLFVSDERSQSISVIDVTSRGMIGKIPVGNAPVGLAFSNDERYLFTTSQTIPGWPLACHPEVNPSAPVVRAQGAVFVVDVQRARSDPANAVVGRAAAGCNPVRVAVSPDGARVYVSARGSHALLVFDAARLTTDTANALIASVNVGTSPVGVLAMSDRILVTNSARFTAGADHQTLSVVDAQSLKVIGSIPAGGFPRELRLMSDGSTVLLTNFGSGSVEIIDLARSRDRL